MTVHHYKTAGGKRLVLEYIHSLSKKEILDGLSVLQAFEESRLNDINTKTWRGKIWEAYFYKHNRIFYFTVKGNDIYLLHACRKQKGKTESFDSDTVVKRAKELENELSVKLL